MQKGVYPMIRCYLDGVSASSVYEARLGREEMGGEVHAAAPAYSEADVQALLPYCTTMVFNSFSQWELFRPLLASSPTAPSPGLRLNLEYSEVESEGYSLYAQGDRLGVRRRELDWRSSGVPRHGSQYHGQKQQLLRPAATGHCDVGSDVEKLSHGAYV